MTLSTNQYPEGQFVDIDDPHHSLCTHAIHADHPEVLMVAGSHHKTGQGPATQAHFHELEKYLRDHFPVSSITHTWSAQHYQTADNVPYIGLASRFVKHIYLATGYYADGLIYGTLAGIMLSELLLKNKSSLADLYQANRFKPLASAAFLAKENSNVWLQYMKDLPLRNTHSFNNIKAGQGKVVEVDQQKLAVSRDNDNKLHVVSAVCTHMKGIVNWNDAEQTWDCPCHGSRFTNDGKVIEGPATEDLPIINKED